MQKREYPSIPVVCVGAVIFNDSKILLIKRQHEPKAQLWTLPGGIIEIGEKTEQAIIREVKEECGILIKPIKIVDVIDYIERDTSSKVLYHYVIIDFEAEYISGVMNASSDALEAKWFSKSEIKKANLPEITHAFLSKHYHLLN